MRSPFPFIAASAVVAGSAAAQDAVISLDPLIVTASRMEERLSDSPYTSSILDGKIFTESQARTVPDALGTIPGVMVQKTTHGHGSPYIRGFTGRQNLYLIDGIRLNNSAWRSGPVQYANTIDPYLIERLEVVKGQGSVLYGSDAIGGTVNAITKDSGFRDETAGAAFLHGAAFYRLDHNGPSHVGRLETRFGEGGRFGIMLGLSAKDYGDIRAADIGRMDHTGYPEQNLDFKLEYALGDNVTFTLAHQYLNQDDVWRWHSTIYNPGWSHSGSATTPGTYLSRIFDQERSLTYARLESVARNGFIDRWSATLSYQQHHESESQARTPTDVRFQSSDAQTYGIAFQLESDIGSGTAIYGGDYYWDEISSLGVRNGAFRPDFRPLADDSRYGTFGVFSQYRWQPWQPLTVTAGTRYTQAEARLGRYFDPATSTDLSARRHWDGMVSSLRALYRIGNAWKLYGGASQGFRAPNLDDLSGNLTSRSGLASLGNVDVEPERFIHYELGLRREAGPARFGVTAFYTDIRDIVTSVPTAAGSTTTVTSNGQNGYVYGFEIDAAWRISDDWILRGSGSWVDGKTDTEAFLGGPETREPLSRLMPLSGTVALRWTRPDHRLWVEARAMAAARADRLSSGDRTDTQRIPVGGTPGYLVFGVHGGWRATDDLALTLGIDNLTDQAYRIHGSGQNEPGLNAIAGLQWTW